MEKLQPTPDDKASHPQIWSMVRDVPARLDVRRLLLRRFAMRSCSSSYPKLRLRAVAYTGLARVPREIATDREARTVGETVERRPERAVTRTTAAVR